MLHIFIINIHKYCGRGIYVYILSTIFFCITEEGEVDNLHEEANLPLGELLTKFGMPSNKNQRSLRKKVHREDLLSPVVNKKKPVFPLLSSNDDKTVTNGSEVARNDRSISEIESETVKTEIKCEEEKSGKLVQNGEKKGEKNGNSANTTCESHSKDASPTVDQESSKNSESEAVCNGKPEDGKTQEGEFMNDVFLSFPNRFFFNEIGDSAFINLNVFIYNSVH